MQVLVNDETVELPERASVADLIERLGLTGRSVAVERNLEIVPRSRHGETQLADGDRLEVVTLVGGG